MARAVERIFWYLLAALLLLSVLFGSLSCTATQAGPDATVQTAAVLANVEASAETLTAKVEAIQTRWGDMQVQGVDELTQALATFKVDIEAAAVKIEQTANAGRDVNQADYWGTRFLIFMGFVYLVVDRIVDRRRRSGGVSIAGGL